MQQVAVVGVGDMGSGLAKNLLNNGYRVKGYDLSEQRMQALVDMGGVAASDPADAGRGSDAAWVMVMNGDQAHEVILDNGLASTMNPGSVILLSATIRASEARSINTALAGTGISLIDTPVSGGFPGAQNGTLTLMAAADAALLEKWSGVMQAVSGTIHHVGEEPGMGQTVKACLQSLMGAIFSATFEASVLAAKAGVDAETMEKVINTSSAGSVVTRTSMANIIDRKFENTGSHIRTMYKDMTLSMDLARELGVPLFTAGTAMQLFQAGMTRYPDGDNWAVTQITEEIVDAALSRKPAKP